MSAEELIFNWRHEFLVRGITASDAEAEMKRIEKTFGALTPKNVLEASRAETSLFHSCFEWNNDKAAEKFRIQQARVLLNNIQVTIVRKGSEPIIVPYYEVVKDGNGRNKYVDVNSILTDFNNLEQVLRNARKELEYWKLKYSRYNELNKASKQLDKVLELLEK